MAIPTKPTYTHGSTGTEPTQAINYANGDPVDADEFDYFLNTPFEKIKDIIDTLNDIDSGALTVGSATDAANVTGTYKGNDIDSNGDGIVDAANNSTLVKGNDIDSDGDGRVNAADTSTLVKGNDIDTDGDGIVDDAENVTGTYKGNDIDSDGDGSVDDAENVRGVDIFVDAISASESGIVNAGNAATVVSTELQDQERLRIYRAAFHAPGGSPASNGVDLIVASFDSSGDTSEVTILSGDGASLYSKEVGQPLASYQNTDGEVQHIEIMIDNGHFNTGTGSNENVVANITARIE